MNRSETAQLLALAASYDQRTVGDADVMAWADLLARTSFADAVTVVKAHYATTRDRVMPVDVISGARRLRAERLDRNPMPDPPADLDADQVAAYIAWLRDTRKAIADGDLETEQPQLPARGRDYSRVFRTIPNELEAS